MTTMRSLLLLAFLVLISGCYNFYNACQDPDAISEKWVPQCFYHLKVLATDPKNSTVTAQYADDYRQDTTKPMQEFTFRVRDLDHLGLVQDQGYFFVRQGSSPYLEPFYGTPKCIYDYEKGNSTPGCK